MRGTRSLFHISITLLATTAPFFGKGGYIAGGDVLAGVQIACFLFGLSNIILILLPSIFSLRVICIVIGIFAIGYAGNLVQIIQTDDMMIHPAASSIKVVAFLYLMLIVLQMIALLTLIIRRKRSQLDSRAEDSSVKVW